jgi:hypothetical protein
MLACSTTGSLEHFTFESNSRRVRPQRPSNDEDRDTDTDKQGSDRSKLDAVLPPPVWSPIIRSMRGIPGKDFPPEEASLGRDLVDSSQDAQHPDEGEDARISEPKHPCVRRSGSRDQPDNQRRLETLARQPLVLSSSTATIVGRADLSTDGARAP